LHILNKAELADGARSDPLKISRCISAMVCVEGQLSVYVHAAVGLIG